MNPSLLFLLLFVAAPLTELYVLIEVGSEIGALTTILLSVFTAVLGGALVRLQGFSVLKRVQQSMNRGEPPALEMLEGAALMLSGLALLLPGFITDAVGFLLLIPPVRRGLVLWMLKRGGVMRPPPGHQSSAPESHPGRIIEGEARREDD